MSSRDFEFINPRYLLGISDEPKQMLQPISGYAREPLLTLEEACRPLTAIVPQLQAHIWVAKQNAKNPSDNLTEDESAAIRLYTMEWDTSDSGPRGSLYSHLNRTLKLIDRTKLRPWFRYLKLFLTALAKLPPAPRQTVWRGVRKNHSEDYPTGAQATWWAFSSCTTSLNVLESDLYLGNVGTRTLFSIETINARTIRAHSHFKVEDEILLLPGTFFEVKSRLNPAPDLYIIHLSQKQPPYDLLEPPFEGAEIFPPAEHRIDVRDSRDHDSTPEKDASTPLYKKKKIIIPIVAIILAVILAIILGATLSTRSKQRTSTSTLSTSIPTSFFNLNGSIPAPVSVSDAFYAFDDNTFDLYSLRNGQVIGGNVSYVQGYVAYGKAIVFDQSISTYIQMQPGFNLSASTSFTIEGFFLLQNPQLTATLVQLTSTIALSLVGNQLRLSLGTNSIITGSTVIGTGLWHHLSCVYDATQEIATIYIDNSIEATQTSVRADIGSDKNDSSIVVGTGYIGFIDQLSIGIQAKASGVISWDALVSGYYPLDVQWLLDRGPNGLNGTATGAVPVYGWYNNALNFNASGANFQASGFTALGTPGSAFSIALWVRAEAQGGVFLTVANPYTCLLVLGLDNQTNNLVVYLPNATVSGTGVNIIGPQMPFVWVNVVVTWSYQHLAQLYTSGYFQSVNTDASVLNNARGGNDSSPMTITLGRYTGAANCQGIAGVDTTQDFKGTLDELYVFSSELQLSDIKALIIPYTS